MKRKILLFTCMITLLSMLTGCAASTQLIKTTKGNFNLSFKGKYERTVKEKEDATGLYIQDSTDTTMVDATYVYPDQVSLPADYKKETINERTYIVFPLEEEIYYCTYLADVGADIGLVFVVDSDKKEEMNYISLSGKSLKDASSDPATYFTTIVEEQAEDKTEDTDSENKEISENEFKFVNGETFHSDVNFTYNSTENDSITTWISDDELMGLSLFTITDESAFVDQTASLFKDASGEAPMITYNEEGTYITGFTRESIDLIFLSEGVDGNYYVIELTTLSEDCLDVMYQLVDDLLASGITVADSRIAYEKGETDYDEAQITEDIEAAEYDGYKANYVCEYFTSYVNDDYSVSIYVEPQEEYVDVKNNGSSEALDYYDKINTSDIKVSGKNFCLIEMISGDMYSYAAISDDETICIEFNSTFGTVLKKDEVQSILKTFVK